MADALMCRCYQSLYYCGKNHINPSCWWESGGMIVADAIDVR